jgi:hypothetical protein
VFDEGVGERGRVVGGVAQRVQALVLIPVDADEQGPAL